MARRSNLSDFIKDRCIEAARAAMAEGGGQIEDAIAERLLKDVVRNPKVQLRIKKAGRNEREKFEKEIPGFMRELQGARLCAA